MLKLGRVTKFKMLFLVLVFVFNFDLLKFSAAILEKGLLLMYLIHIPLKISRDNTFKSFLSCVVQNAFRYKNCDSKESSTFSAVVSLFDDTFMKSV